MLPTPRRIAAAATAGLVLAAVAVSPVLAAPRAAAPSSLASPLALGGKTYSGFSNGTLEYVNALNLGPDVAKAGLGQSAAGVQTPGLTTAITRDQLKQPVLIASAAGKTAYGHASGLNVGLLGEVTDEPNVLEETLVEATSPAPSGKEGELLELPLSPVATATVLPGFAAANTLASGACVTGKDLSYGEASLANAQALIPGAGQAVANVEEVSTTVSTTRLIANGTRTGLRSQTILELAPITLFQGIADLEIEVLAPIQLTASAGGTPGTSVVTYGASGISADKPILRLAFQGEETTLTSQQLFGNGGIVLPLGIADVTIGAPAHSLTGLEGTAVTKAANGTNASAAADFIRVTVPGALATPGQDPVDGPLAPVLNPVLNPALDALDPLLAGLQDALTSAGLNIADVRIGHMEASSTVPVDGIDCGTDENPLNESRKDVSATNVTAGQTFNYTLRIPNRGSSPITNVTVTDTYSAGLEFVSSVPAPASHTGNVLKYNLGTLEPNEFATIVLTFKVPTNAVAGTVYTNRAVITGTYNGAPVTFPVQVTGPTVVATLPGACNLSGSTKYASNTHVKTGANFGYFVNVFNSGGTTCNDVVVKDTLINGVTFVSCNLSCTHSGQNVTWNLGSIPSGASETLFVIVKVTATSGRLPNAAIITTSNGTGGNPNTPGPIVTNISVPAPGVPATLVRDDGGQLPRTGMSAAAAALGGLLLLGGSLVWRRRQLGETS